MLTIADGVDLPDRDYFALPWQPLAHGELGYAMLSDPQGFEDFPERVGVTGRAYNFLLSRVVPGQTIETHVDSAYTQRVHVPLVTNPQAYWVEEGERFHMEVGKAYLVDPSRPHAVVNEGPSDRIHLMFDVSEVG